MDRQDGFGPARHLAGDLAGVEVERLRIDVGEHGTRPEAGDDARGGEERKGGRHDLVARTHPEGHQRDEQGIRSGRDPDGGARLAKPGELGLERGDFRSQNEILRIADAVHRVADLLTNRRILRPSGREGGL